MSEAPVMINEAHVAAVVGAVKTMAMATVSAFGVVYAGVTAITGGAEGNMVAIGTTLGVSVTFAGLILRMVIKNQAAIWDIVRSKDDEIRQLKLDKEYVQWEREQARFRANERTDPGPFVPSPQLAHQLEAMDTMNSDPS